MSDDVHIDPPPAHPLSEGEIVDLAKALAGGRTVDLSRLSHTDACAVLCIVRALVARRPEFLQQQTEPSQAQQLTEEQVCENLDVLRVVREDPGSIVTEIMAEPLLQAALVILVQMISLTTEAVPQAITDRVQESVARAAAAPATALEDRIQEGLDRYVRALATTVPGGSGS